MIENGHEAPEAAASFVTSSEMAPSTASAVGSQSSFGIMPKTLDSIANQQDTHLLPTGQVVGERKMRGFDQKSRFNITPGTDIVTAPPSLYSTRVGKYGPGGNDPDPLYPLPPANPVDVRATRPKRFLPGQNVLSTLPLNEQWNGNMVQTSKDQFEESRKVRVADTSEEGTSYNSTALLHAATQNYLWSRARNVSVRPVGGH
jgi:hypothetical protein